MAVRVQCSDSQALLDSIRKAIRNQTVETWNIDSDGDLTHAPDQWKNKAWFRPKVSHDELLIFNILSPRGKRMSRTVYGVYHGRLIEMLLVHFDEEFSRASATALPVSGDVVDASE
jgi:hypothetical protein